MLQSPLTTRTRRVRSARKKIPPRCNRVPCGAKSTQVHDRQLVGISKNELTPPLIENRAPPALSVADPLS
jgi:hypothetical protein